MRAMTLLAGVILGTGLVWANYESSPVWDRAYGGSNYDVGKDIALDPDGYYVVVGGTKSLGTGNYDYWILKIDPETGDTVWAKTYGGSGYDYASGVDVDPGGFYIVNGITASFGAGQHDFWVLKIDASTGDTVWSRTVGGADFDQGFDVMVDGDGNYVLIGSSRTYGTSGTYDGYVVKMDPDGNVLWSTSIGGSDFDRLFAVAEDGNAYIVAGYEESPDVNSDTSRQGWIIKLDKGTGSVIWNRSFGGPSYDVFMDVMVDSAGYYIVAGRTASFGAGDRDGWLLKIEPSTGDTLWSSVIGGLNDDRFYGLAIDQRNGYIAIGYTSTYGAGSNDMWFVKFNEDGDTIWTATFGADSADRGERIMVDDEGYYIGVGYTRSYGSGKKDFWIVKLKGLDLNPPYVDSLTVLDRDTTADARDVDVFATDDKAGIEHVNLFYRVGVSGSWNSIPMNPAVGGWFGGQIPSLPLPTDSVQVFYFAAASDSAGNASSTDTLFYWLVNPAVSRGENAPSIRITPVSGGLWISGLNPPYEIRIFNPSGRLVRHIENYYGDIRISLPASIYIVEIRENNRSLRRKIVIR